MTFVDLHCHLLAGLDDGPDTTETALALCRMACAQGIRTAAATVHQLGNYRHNHRATIVDATTALARQLAMAAIDLQIYPSAEWMVDSTFIERMDELWATLLTINNQGRHALLEFPYHPPHHTAIIAELLKGHGVTPILAHVDAYAGLFADPSALRRLRSEGYIVQMNADTIDGRRGRKTQKQARRLIAAGLIDLVATDAHNSTSRPPNLQNAHGLVQRWGGNQLASLLFHDNPLAILRGEDITPPAAISIGRRMRSWLP